MAQGAVRVEEVTPERFAALEALQAAAYPTLGADDLIRERHLAAHHAAFPEGQHCAIDEATNEVLGMNCTLLLDRFDTSSPQHRFLDVTGDLMFTTHCPGGEWMYGADICVSPGARGRGIGRALYDARKAACRRLNCRAIVSGGLLAGYGRFAAEESTTGGTKEPLNPEAYVERVVAGELRDPTLSFQLHNGFEVLGVIKDYVEDPSCGGYAAAIVWWNPDFRSR